MGVADGGEQAGKALFDFGAARGVAHLDAVAFAADEAVFAQDFEMLRECRFGDGLIADGEKAGTAFRAALRSDSGINGDADRIGKRVEDALDGDIFEGRMDEGPHTEQISQGWARVQ